MASDGTEPQTGRETRLLVLVVGVAIVVLLLLAQWQFPESSLSVVSPNSAPLAGLAARATFDEMSSSMVDVISRVSPLAAVVPLERDVVAEAGTGAGRGTPAREKAEEVAPPDRPVRWALAVRVRPDLALVHVPAGLRPRNGAGTPIEVVAHDPTREMMLIRVAPASAAPDTLSASVRTFPNFVYVAAVDATPVGPTVQPVFVGRTDTVADPQWSHALVPASVAPGLSPGSFVFSLNSRLIGVVVQRAEGPMIVPAPALETLVQALESPGGTAP
ncbi:MAG: hypothetical protein IT183_09405 [Acidobacteria bacterium]|nr:hypothetical protein [Acidobacteriota bacterium]